MPLFLDIEVIREKTSLQKVSEVAVNGPKGAIALCLDSLDKFEHI